MASFNRVILLGNLTRDPEIRYTQSGLAVCNLGLAVNERYKNANGDLVDEPVFVDVTLWKREAEVASEYLSKGSPVLIEGRLKLDTWQGTDGQKRSKLLVVCLRLQLLGSRQGGGPPGEGDPPGEGVPRPAPRREPQRSQPGPVHEEFDAPPPDMPPGDDIPF